MPPIINQTPERVDQFPQDVMAVSGIADGGSNAMFGGGARRFANMLWTGTAGNIAILLDDGKSVITFPAVAAGQWHRMPPFRNIQLTGTYASPVIIVGAAFK